MLSADEGFVSGWLARRRGELEPNLRLVERSGHELTN